METKKVSEMEYKEVLSTTETAENNDLVESEKDSGDWTILEIKR